MTSKPDLPWHPAVPDTPNAPADDVRGFSIGGKVWLERPFALAPMSGVTDTAFRRMVQLASRGTVGLFVTEFISIDGLTADNVLARTRMLFDPELERPISVQIFGANPKRMAEAARVAADRGAQIVDINCGCPAPRVVRRGGGAELMRQPELLARLVQATVEAVDVPVTVKIRSGWDEADRNAVQIARLAEDAGAAMVAVHGRTRVQLYAGDPDWSLVAQVAQAVKIPVVGSGDIASAQDALDRLRTSGCAGVMIGRGAIMNPWIFGQIDDLVAGRAPREPDNAERLALLRGFAAMMAEIMPDYAIPGRLKQLLARLTKGMPHGMLLRGRVLREPTTALMFEWIERFFEAADNGTLDAFAEAARARNDQRPWTARGADGSGCGG